MLVNKISKLIKKYLKYIDNKLLEIGNKIL